MSASRGHRLDIGDNMNVAVRNKTLDFLFHLAMAPTVFALIVLIGAVAGFDMEKLWVFPAVLVVACAVLQYAGLSVKAVLIGVPVLTLVAVRANLRAILFADESTIMSPVTLFVSLVVTIFVGLAIIWSVFYVLNRLRTLLASRIRYAAIPLVVIGYALVAYGMLLFENPYYGYWITTYERRLSLAIRHGWNDRVRTMATYLAKKQNLASNLCHAAGVNNVEAVKILLELGANPLAKESGTPPRDTFTCATEGASLESLKVVLAAVPNGPPQSVVWDAAKAPDEWDARSPNSDTDRARLLEFVLERYPADTVRTLRDSEGNTLLHWVMSKCCAGPEQVQALLRKGADPIAKNKGGRTPLDNAKLLLNTLHNYPEDSVAKRKAVASAEAIRRSIGAQKETADRSQPSGR